MMQEHDNIVLTTDLPAEGLKAGDVGTIVHIHGTGEGFEVEFFALTGQTIAIVTVLPSQLRAVTARDVAHVRELQVR